MAEHGRCTKHPMMRGDSTLDGIDEPQADAANLGPPEPGLVQLYATDATRYAVTAFRGSIALGRALDCGVPIDDPRASRRHASVEHDAGRWLVRDLGSHNGTFLDGRRLVEPTAAEGEAILAVGNALFLLVPDVRPMRAGIAIDGDVVVGPRLRAVWDKIDLLARSSPTLHVMGPTGSGKELAARRFHAAGGRSAGPFVAVNCAAVPGPLAERLFFGARRGTYSGADADSDGYLLAADGGTLFLDEVGELSLEVQAKLLRAIETREVLPLGASRARKVNLAVCSATHADLRGDVAAGRFREDLYFRLAQPTVRVPALRARREEIPTIIERALDGLRAHAAFVEGALLRPWPGNVRELLSAVGIAAQLAVHDTDPRLKLAHLGELGREIHETSAERAALSTLTSTPSEPWQPAPDASIDATTAAILDALRRENGNVTRAARDLRVHRNQLRRWLERHQVDPRQFRRELPIGGDPE
jgi:transcriptional regulator of acetoin/glycerol metabolism